MKSYRSKNICNPNQNPCCCLEGDHPNEVSSRFLCHPDCKHNEKAGISLGKTVLLDSLETHIPFLKNYHNQLQRDTVFRFSQNVVWLYLLVS